MNHTNQAKGRQDGKEMCGVGNVRSPTTSRDPDRPNKTNSKNPLKALVKGVAYLVAIILLFAGIMHVFIWAGILWVIHESTDANVLIGRVTGDTLIAESFGLFTYTDYNCSCDGIAPKSWNVLDLNPRIPR